MQKKGMFDILSKSKPAICDLKTTTVVGHDAYAALSFRLGYWISLGSYRAWHNQECPSTQIEEVVQFVLNVNPPYDLCVRPMDDQELALGHKVQLNACGTLKDAIKNERWGDSGNGMPVPLTFPRWAVPESMEMVEFGG